MSIAELNEQLKFEIDEAGRPYALMFENTMRLEKFRQAVEFEYWRKDDKYVSLTLDQDNKIFRIEITPFPYLDVFKGLWIGFKIQSEIFAKVTPGHVNDPRNIERARTGFLNTSRIATIPRKCIEYVVPRIYKKFPPIKKALSDVNREKFVNYINYEPAWKQETYDFEILRGEPPLKLYKGILEMPYELQTMFTYSYRLEPPFEEDKEKGNKGDVNNDEQP